MLGAFNFSLDDAVISPFPGGKAVDMISGKKLEMGELDVPAHDFVWALSE